MKVLVADDEVHIVMLLKITLEMNGYEVILARDGLEALEKVTSDSPDLILLDIKMPKLNGWQVCEKLKSNEQTRKIPIIMVTAFAQSEARQRSLDLGADDYITKPFESSFLLESIKKVIDSKGKNRSS
jgi:DNA-binding response OmpR family regulator